MAISEEDNVLLFEQQRLDPIPEHTYEEPVWESFLSHFTDYWQPYSGSFQSFPWTENLVLATGSGQLSTKVENCNSESFSTCVSSSSLPPPSNPTTVHQPAHTNSISGTPFITTSTVCASGNGVEAVVTAAGLGVGAITTKNNDNNNYADTATASTLPNALINNSNAGRIPAPPIGSNILSGANSLSPNLVEEALQADQELFPQQNHNTLVMELNSLVRSARHAGKSKNKSRTTDLFSGSAPLDRTCPICKKTFTRKISVNVHMVVHTNLKPYACDFPGCKKKFNVKGNLQRHSKCHRPEKSLRRLSERTNVNRIQESTRIAEGLNITKARVEETDTEVLPVAVTLDNTATELPPGVPSAAKPVNGSVCIDGTSEIGSLDASSSSRIDLELTSREGSAHTNFYDNSFSRYLYEDAEL